MFCSLLQPEEFAHFMLTGLLVDIMQIRKQLILAVNTGIAALLVVGLYLRPYGNTLFTSHLETAYSSVPQNNWNITRKVLPHCIIAGVAKCGTRALLEYLELHTHISTAPQEVQFFNKDLNYDKGLKWYKSRMKSSYPHQLTLEKNTFIFC